jgi:hypothetical protein
MTSSLGLALTSVPTSGMTKTQFCTPEHKVLVCLSQNKCSLYLRIYRF